jgi:hypothetical protein
MWPAPDYERLTFNHKHHNDTLENQTASRCGRFTLAVVIENNLHKVWLLYPEDVGSRFLENKNA